MIFRKAEVADALEIMKLHKCSVLGLCSVDYTPEQLKEWLKSSTLEKYQKRLELHRAFIAEKDGRTVGYVRWNPATNELCSIFVDPNHVRQGIATKLMKMAYEDAASHGVTDMWLDASLTAVPFYEVEGWEHVEERMHGALACIRMVKRVSILPEARSLRED
ncbi:MAG: GNAT family N-acetyltransferase [Chloroflexi bacterium]|nr:GNAT family N-acetyltransferase [Chloroflexota bacterium]